MKAIESYVLIKPAGGHPTSCRHHMRTFLSEAGAGVMWVYESTPCLQLPS